MTEEYECPECWETVDALPQQNCIECPHCKAMLLVNRDGEFVDGMWRNRTKLTVLLK